MEDAIQIAIIVSVSSAEGRRVKAQFGAPPHSFEDVQGQSTSYEAWIDYFRENILDDAVLRGSKFVRTSQD